MSILILILLPIISPTSLPYCPTRQYYTTCLHDSLGNPCFNQCCLGIMVGVDTPSANPTVCSSYPCPPSNNVPPTKSTFSNCTTIPNGTDCWSGCCQNISVPDGLLGGDVVIPGYGVVVCSTNADCCIIHDEPKKNEQRNMSRGQLIGIIIGSVVGTLIIVILIWYFAYHKRRKTMTENGGGVSLVNSENLGNIINIQKDYSVNDKKENDRL